MTNFEENIACKFNGTWPPILSNPLTQAVVGGDAVYSIPSTYLVGAVYSFSSVPPAVGVNATHHHHGLAAVVELATPYTTWQVALLALVAGATSLVTVGGNVIVLLSFFLERSIRQPSNYFIASLAVSDLLIGVCSMPLYMTYILSVKIWPLGQVYGIYICCSSSK